VVKVVKHIVTGLYECIIELKVLNKVVFLKITIN